jgi:hypothetical protein
MSVSAVLTDADATRTEHWKALVRSRPGVWALVLGDSAGLVLGALTGSFLAALLIPVAWTLVLLAGLFVMADGRAAQDFYAAFARSIGFTYVGDTSFLGLTPLLAGGDSRSFTEWMTGAVGAHAAGLGHYEYKVRHRDSNGNETSQAYPFTVALVDLPDSLQRIRGVFARPKRGMLERLADDDWLDTRKSRVHLESTAFEDRYELWRLEDQDDVALRRLFVPSLVLWLAEQPLPLGFELYGGTLAVYLERTHDDAGHLVALLDAAKHLAACVDAEVF